MTGWNYKLFTYEQQIIKLNFNILWRKYYAWKGSKHCCQQGSESKKDIIYSQVNDVLRMGLNGWIVILGKVVFYCS